MHDRHTALHHKSIHWIVNMAPFELPPPALTFEEAEALASTLMKNPEFQGYFTGAQLAAAIDKAVVKRTKTSDEID